MNLNKGVQVFGGSKLAEAPKCCEKKNPVSAFFHELLLSLQTADPLCSGAMNPNCVFVAVVASETARSNVSPRKYKFLELETLAPSVMTPFVSVGFVLNTLLIY